MDKFSKLVDEILEFGWKSSPVSATFDGIHRYDDQLGEFNRDHLEELNSKSKEYLNKLRVLPSTELTEDEKMDYTILTNGIESGIKTFEEIRYWSKDPSIYPNVCLYGIFILGVREFAPLKERMESILSRLEKIPEVMRDGRNNLEDSPMVFTKVAIEVTQGGIEFFETFVPLLAEKIPDLKTDVLKSCEKAIQSFEDYLKFLKEEWLAKSTGEFAIGEELFNYKLKTDHILPYTIDDLLNLGSEIMNETEEEMATLSQSLDPNKNWREIIEDLKRYHPQPDGVVAFYRQEIDKSRQFCIDNDILTIPEEEKLEIIDTPIFHRVTIPYAAYMPPAPFEHEQKGLFYVTPINKKASQKVQEEQLKGHSNFIVPVVALHEAYPGHHVQLLHANKVESKVRKVHSTSVFAEGWALYCEELMYEMGFYKEIEVRLMQLKDQLFRACRVVVDASLHTKKMSYNDAVNFLIDRAKLEETNATAEVKRYCSTPTQPMSYIVGKQEIQKLRMRYEKKHKGKFVLRNFHDRLLSFGTIPVVLVSKRLLNPNNA